jgi:hypothetical protein
MCSAVVLTVMAMPAPPLTAISGARTLRPPVKEIQAKRSSVSCITGFAV